MKPPYIGKQTKEVTSKYARAQVRLSDRRLRDAWATATEAAPLRFEGEDTAMAWAPLPSGGTEQAADGALTEEALSSKSAAAAR